MPGIKQNCAAKENGFVFAAADDRRLAGFRENFRSDSTDCSQIACRRADLRAGAKRSFKNENGDGSFRVLGGFTQRSVVRNARSQRNQ
jgi:hypothetical protein